MSRHLLRRLLFSPSVMAGALAFFTFGAAESTRGVSGLRQLVQGVVGGTLAALIGMLFGLAVGALIRAFRVHPLAYPAVGFLASPAVLALVGAGREEGALGIAAVFGLVLGFIEWGAEWRRREAAGSAAGGPSARGPRTGLGPTPGD